MKKLYIRITDNGLPVTTTLKMSSSKGEKSPNARPYLKTNGIVGFYNVVGHKYIEMPVEDTGYVWSPVMRKWIKGRPSSNEQPRRI